jgi:hypothetical protein
MSRANVDRWPCLSELIGLVQRPDRNGTLENDRKGITSGDAHGPIRPPARSPC